MIAAPWYLLSLGIALLLLGYVLSSVAQPPRVDAIDPRMSDEEIAENLHARERGSWTNYVSFAGLVLIGISLVWRILRRIL